MKPLATVAVMLSTAVGRDAFVDHLFAAGSYASTVASGTPVKVEPPMAYTRPLSATAASVARFVGIGLAFDHLLVKVS